MEHHNEAFSDEQKIADAEMQETVKVFSLLKNQQQPAEEGTLSQGYHQITHEEAQLIVEEGRLLVEEVRINLAKGWQLIEKARQFIEGQ